MTEQLKTWYCPNQCRGSYTIQTNFNNGVTTESAKCSVCSSVMELVLVTMPESSHQRYPVTDQQNF